MPLSPNVIEILKSNSPAQHQLTIDEPAFTDLDLLGLFQLLAGNTHIDSVQILSHNLTPKSYDPILQFLKSRPTMVQFSYRCIMPLSIAGSMYNEAILEILKENRQRVTERLEAEKAEILPTQEEKAKLDG